VFEQIHFTECFNFVFYQLIKLIFTFFFVDVYFSTNIFLLRHVRGEISILLFLTYILYLAVYAATHVVPKKQQCPSKN